MTTEQEIVQHMENGLDPSKVVLECANCDGHIFVCVITNVLSTNTMSGYDLILWGHVEDNGCDDPTLKE